MAATASKRHEMEKLVRKYPLGRHTEPTYFCPVTGAKKLK